MTPAGVISGFVHTRAYGVVLSPPFDPIPKIVVYINSTTNGQSLYNQALKIMGSLLMVKRNISF